MGMGWTVQVSSDKWKKEMCVGGGKREGTGKRGKVFNCPPSGPSSFCV